MTITNGYTTLAKIKGILDATSTNATDDSVIEYMVEQASRVIDNLTGRTFYARTETHYLNVPEGRTLDLDDDLLTVTSLTNGDGTVLTTSSYYLYPRNRAPYFQIVMKESSLYAWEETSAGDSEGAITLVGTWGFSTTAPADIEIACQEIVKKVYHNRYGVDTQGTAQITAAGIVITPGGVPDSAMQIVSSYLRRT